MDIKMLGDRILVEEVTFSENVVGGIIMPSSVTDTPRECVVVAVSNTLVDEINVGDTVLISKQGGIEVEIDEKMFMIVDILCIIAVVEFK